MIAGVRRIGDAGEMDHTEFAAFYARYAEHCIRAGMQPLAPTDAATLHAVLGDYLRALKTGRIAKESVGMLNAARSGTNLCHYH
jgi:hypothetical protein